MELNGESSSAMNRVGLRKVKSELGMYLGVLLDNVKRIYFSFWSMKTLLAMGEMGEEKHGFLSSNVCGIK